MNVRATTLNPRVSLVPMRYRLDLSCLAKQLLRAVLRVMTAASSRKSLHSTECALLHGRPWRMRGWAMVRCDGAHRAHRRYLRLKHYALSICDGADDNHSRVLLKAVLVGRGVESDERRHELVVITSKHETIIISFLAKTDFELWKEAFTDATREPGTYYDMERALFIGAGAFSKVYAAIERDSGVTVAVKVVCKKACSRSELLHAEEEARVMSKVCHPAVVTCRDVFDSPTALHFVLDYVPGGTLDARVRRLLRNGGSISESAVAAVMTRLLSALAYLHSYGVVHRDLKPDNILVDLYKGDDTWASSARVCDFGLAAFIGEHRLTEFVGTPHFVAPDLLARNADGSRSGYGYAVDVWAAGVIAFWMLSGGNLPFDGEDNSDVCRAVRAGAPELCESVSEPARSFVRSLLHPHPDTRLTAAAALMHPWLSQSQGKTDAKKTDGERTQATRKSLNPHRLLRAAAFSVLAIRRISNTLENTTQDVVAPNSSPRRKSFRNSLFRMRCAHIDQFVLGFG